MSSPPNDAAAREPMALMIDAALAAVAEALLRTVRRTSVPVGRWAYGDPASFTLEETR